jgi:hypothetical protein
LLQLRTPLPSAASPGRALSSPKKKYTPRCGRAFHPEDEPLAPEQWKRW